MCVYFDKHSAVYRMYHVKYVYGDMHGDMIENIVMLIHVKYTVWCQIHDNATVLIQQCLDVLIYVNFIFSCKWL